MTYDVTSGVREYRGNPRACLFYATIMGSIRILRFGGDFGRKGKREMRKREGREKQVKWKDEGNKGKRENGE